MTFLMEIFVICSVRYQVIDIYAFFHTNLKYLIAVFLFESYHPFLRSKSCFQTGSIGRSVRVFLCVLH